MSGGRSTGYEYSVHGGREQARVPLRVRADVLGRRWLVLPGLAFVPYVPALHPTIGFIRRWARVSSGFRGLIQWGRMVPYHSEAWSSDASVDRTTKVNKGRKRRYNRAVDKSRTLQEQISRGFPKIKAFKPYQTR